jgi:hypothetical protein
MMGGQGWGAVGQAAGAGAPEASVRLGGVIGNHEDTKPAKKR